MTDTSPGPGAGAVIGTGTSPGSGHPGAGVYLGTLRLRVGTMDEDAATELARMVARQLVPGLTAAAGCVAPGPSGTVSVRVAAPTGGPGPADPGALARTVADAVLAALLAGDGAGLPPEGAAP